MILGLNASQPMDLIKNANKLQNLSLIETVYLWVASSVYRSFFLPYRFLFITCKIMIMIIRHILNNQFYEQELALKRYSTIQITSSNDMKIK